MEGFVAELQQGGSLIRLVQGDITERRVDAIVNAAGSYLQHGGGVAAAIVRKGGRVIREESDRIDYVPVGSVAITSAGRLPCKAVIHAVGPRMGEGDEDNKLRQAMRAIFLAAEKNNWKRISIPAISSGIFGFPKDRCAEILVEESKAFCKSKSGVINIIEFCILDADTVVHFEREFRR